MKKYLLPSILVLALASGLAWAQNITQSLQGTQFANGPVGLDANFNAYFPNHMNAFGNKGLPPTVAAGGVTFLTGTTPTDNVAKISIPASVTTLTLSFGQAFGSVPACSLQEEAGTVAPTYTTATTGVLATVVASSKTYNLLCFAQQ